MKSKLFSSLLLAAVLLMACKSERTSSSPAPIPLDADITLAPGQSTTVTGTDLTITFHSVVSDERCPSQVECAASGPVTVSLSVQQGDGTPNDFTLQTFTDQNGRAPNVQFEGVTNRAELGEYVIQIAGVTPYPTDPSTKIDPSQYRVGLTVLRK